MKTSLRFTAILALPLLFLTLFGCAQKVDEAEAVAPYPLDTCLVSDEKLGEDPEMVPYTFVHEGQEIKLCCKSCLKGFNKEPEKYMAKLLLAGSPVKPAEPAPTE